MPCEAPSTSSKAAYPPPASAISNACLRLRSCGGCIATMAVRARGRRCAWQHFIQRQGQGSLSAWLGRSMGDAWIPRGEDRRRRLGGYPRLGARSGREAVQAPPRAAAQSARGANDPRRLRRRPPGAGGVRRGKPGGALRHRAVAPRRTDPAAALADPRHDARAGGRDPRGPLHILSQNATAAGRNLPARLITRLGAVPRRPASEAPRHGRPCPAQEPLPGDGLCHGDFQPDNVIMTAEGPRAIDWTWTRRVGPALDLGHCQVVLCELIPENHDDPERPRALNAAVQSEYERLGGMSPRGADGSDGVLLAHRPRLLPPRMDG